MPTVIYVITAIAALALIVALVWRFSSTRFSLPCPAWLGWMVELDNPLFRNNRARVILDYLDVQPGMRVLDFGCGPGRLTVPAAKQVGPEGEISAVDIQPEMLARVRAKAETENLDNIRYMDRKTGDSLAGDAFDRALLVTVLGEIPEREAVLREIYASLKPGGILSVTEVIADPHFLRRETVTEAALAAGFVEKAFYGWSLSYTMHFEKA